MKRIVFVLTLLVCPAAAHGTYTLYAVYDETGTSMDDTELEEHFNLARCLCDEAVGADDGYSTILALDYDGDYDGSDHYFYLGSDCSNTAVDIDTCADLGSENVNSLSSSLLYVPIPMNYLVDPDGGACSEVSSGSNTLSVFSSLESRTVEYSYTISYDTKPPTAPYDVSVASGENALIVSWDNEDPDTEGTERFDVLCMRSDGVTGVPGESASEGKADWVDSEQVCGQVLSLSEKKSHNLKSDLTCPRDGVASGERAVACYVCASVASSVNKVRIEGLENGVEYTISVVAVDDYNNASEQSDTVSGTPMPTTDFAEQYAASGGTADGHYCFFGGTIFKDQDHPALEPLRAFRDSVLMHFAAGRAFVSYYYSHGRGWDRFLRRHAALGAVLIPLMGILLLILSALLCVPLWFWGGLGLLWLWRRRLSALAQANLVARPGMPVRKRAPLPC